MLLTQTPQLISGANSSTSSVPVIIGKQENGVSSLRNAAPIDAIINSPTDEVATNPSTPNKAKKKPIISPEDYLFLEPEKPYVPQYFPITIGNKTIQAEYAYDLRRQIKGLAGRKSISADSGLFYAFADAGNYYFWMRGMLFPIDIIWFASDGRVVDVKENISPDTFPEKFTSRELAQYILEASAGFAKRNGFFIGAKADLSKFSK